MVNQNLRHLRKQNGLTQEELAQKLEIKRSLLGAYEEGRAEPRLLTLVRVAKIFSISLDKLVTEDLQQTQPELPPKHERQEKKLRILSITVDRDGNENIDLVPQKASAGYLNGYADPEYIEELPKFRLPMLGSGGTFRAFEISGDSMLPVQSGTVVVGRYVDDWQEIKDGTPCIIVSQKEGIVFKRIYNKLRREARLSLHSDNVLYAPYEVEADEVLEIWEARAYISTALPKPEMSLDKLASIVMDLKKEVQQMKVS